MKKEKDRRRVVLVALLAVSALVLAGAPLIGMRSVPLDALFRIFSGGLDTDIIWKIRVPRVCVSFLAGAALALSGLAFQTLFRSPLAEPFTLGVASGASLGAVIYIRLGLVFSIAGLSGISFFAFAGAILSILLVYGLTRLAKGFNTGTMLLSGVAISFFFSSLILFTQYMSDFARSAHMMRWLMGGLEVAGFESVLNVAPFVVVGSVVMLLLTHELNLLAAGEEIAISRGVDAAKTMKVLFLGSSAMVGSVVAVCGPIGFVGIMVPHMCRLIIGVDHRYLTPASLLFGGSFLTLCDTVARTIIAPAEIPVGIITALLGGPFFIWLLLGNPLPGKRTEGKT
ncbi:MAG: iron ABC transporter permease [Deltaproteobacteria bacterium]|nr:iron ABC transporter permease [Deltaproteobacteria bacterium]